MRKNQALIQSDAFPKIYEKQLEIAHQEYRKRNILEDPSKSFLLSDIIYMLGVKRDPQAKNFTREMFK